MGVIRKTKKLISGSLICIMLMLNFYNAYPIQALAQETANGDKQATAISLNCISKNLKLGYKGADTYDFDVVGAGNLSGASFSWYVKADKGNPDAVSINKRTGLVTAKKAGTAYIRCKITLLDGTILRPEARVTVFNNITGVEISNLAETMTIKAGYPTDFNRAITDTKAGKGMVTKGITRWEISDDTAGVKEADDLGMVFPTNEGEFSIRAVCFQNKSQYKLWKANKERYGDYVTAVSQWHTITVAPSDGNAVVSTKKQLDKALVSDSFETITLSTDKDEVFIIERGDYSSKSLVVDAPNADLENYGTFKDITIKAIKDTTWIEYANGNIIYLEDSQLSLVIDSDADIKQIVIDTPGTEINLDIRGRVGNIRVLQPSTINLSGSASDIPVTVEETAENSTITTSVPLNMTLHANTDIALNKGSEGSTIDKSKGSIEVKVDNKSNSYIPITTNKTGRELIYAMSSGISNETTTPSQGSYQPSDMQATSIKLIPSSMVLSVSGSALSMFVAVTTPEHTTDTISWSIDDESVATVDEYGVVTPTGLGTTFVLVSTGNVGMRAQVTVVSGSALDVDVDNISNGLQSFGATIATELGKGAASYIGGQLMGWGLKEAGIGFEDATQEQLNKMNEKLDQISRQLSDLEDKLDDVVSQISKQILDSEYNTRVGQMSDFIGHITSIRDELNRFINNPVKNNPELLEKSRQEIISNIKNHLISNENLIHNQLIGVGSQESLIKVFSRAVKLNHRFVTSKDSEKVTTMYEYFEAVQTSMLELMVEYYHAIGEGGENTNNIDRIISTYDSNIAAQKKLLLQPVPEDIVIDTKLNLMIYNGFHMIVIKATDWTFKILLPAPYYANVEGSVSAVTKMSYNHGYKDWRLLDFDELNSWFNDSRNQSILSYLNNSGWDTPTLNNQSIIGSLIHDVQLLYICGIRLSDLKTMSIFQGREDLPYDKFMSIAYEGKVDTKHRNIYDNMYNWIVCRKIKNELSKYFY